MANWFKHLRRLKQPTVERGQFFAVFWSIVWLPMIGSRSIGGPLSSSMLERVSSMPQQLFDDQSNSPHVPFETSYPTSDKSGLVDKVDDTAKSVNVFGQLSSGGGSGDPCTILSSTDLSNGNFVTFEEKPLITVSHDVFDASYGIVPNILYTVNLEVPPSSRFILEYWGNGGASDRMKRRHQRDRDILELFLKENTTNSSSPDGHPFIFCSKSSLQGENKDTNSTLILSFFWYINTNSLTNGLPSNLIFRLRFISTTSSVGDVSEQSLNVMVRPDCFLIMKVHSASLTMESIWNPHSAIKNQGINCTLLLTPVRAHFGLEVRIANLSIYGMRDICSSKGRYLTFSRVMPSQTQQPHHYSDYYSTSPHELRNEFPTFSYQLPVLGRKFCGKLEDYSPEERILTFKSDSDSGRETETQSPTNVKSQPYPYPRGQSTKNDSDDGDSDMNLNMNENINSLRTSRNALLLRVSLPNSVKSRETFALQLRSLSPCQRVVLRELNGGLKYSKRFNNLVLDEDADECSIVIHVPYGNKIITRMALTRLKINGENEEDDVETNTDYETDKGDGESDTNSNRDPVNNTSTTSSMDYGSFNNYKNYNESRGKQDELEDEESDLMKFTDRIKSYECPFPSISPATINFNEDKDNLQSSTNTKFMMIRAEDIDSGLDFTWCFDGSSDSQSQQKRAWKSSGNKVKITFELKYFNVFHLTYHSVKVEELVGDCDLGWISLNGRCARVVENGSSWTGAEESCQIMGGTHLVTIENEDDEHKIQKMITESALFHPSLAYWIGGNDRESEGKFQWTSGLLFSYKNWFLGWTHSNKGNKIFNAQPNDDGWSGQDCVEIRQSLNPSISYSGKPLSSQFWDGNLQIKPTLPHTNHRHQIYTSIWPYSTFSWNDRNCDAQNFYICEKINEKDYDKDYSCNRTIQLSPGQETLLTVTSPAYPASYPDNIVCLTMIETTPGYRLVMSFDEFVMEESPSCQYDALEIKEIKVLHDQNSTSSNSKGRLQSDIHKRICGDWTKRLKLLRYKTASSTSSLSLKFESDFSHHFAGFKASVWTERDISGQCSDQQMKKFKSYCYLSVSFPAVNWSTAQQVCSSLQGTLASVVSMEEWKFLTQSLPSTSRYDKKSTFWIGGSIDRNSQLVWLDHMPFNFTAFHSSDLQTISDWKCLHVYWGKGEFAWRLADCSQLSGYVCKKKIYEEQAKKTVNKTFSGTGGTQISPNFPSQYPNNLDYAYHLIAPMSTQIVIRFTHMDVEDQEDCLYDYVEIVDKTTKNATRFCGKYSAPGLERLDYVSSSNEVDLFFHTDFSITGTGFEIAWRAVDVAGCFSGKTILAGLGENGFSTQQDDMIHSPNFPHFNLPNLNCLYTIVAPVGQRIWLHFQIFELGQSNTFENECDNQDHVIVDLDGGVSESEEDLSSPFIGNEIILCGNLTSASSFMSLKEKIRIRYSTGDGGKVPTSPIGKSGRGFLGRFKAIPSQLVETLNLATEANSSISFTSVNFPRLPPQNTNLTLALSSPPNYVLTVNINGTSSCPKTAKSYLEIRDPYHGTNGTTWKLCQTEGPTSIPPAIAATSFGSTSKSVEMRDGLNLVNHHNENGDSNVNNKMRRNEISQGITQMSISFRSTFNRLDIRQVYSSSFRGRSWNARISTVLDENFRAKVLADGDRLLKLDGCMNSPCANGGSCISENGKHICRCSAPFTGPFCGLSLCDLNPCLFGDCILGEKSIKCVCQLGYGGEKCDRRMKPCDDNPCSGHGTCVEVNKTAYKCMCYAWFTGPLCEHRMLVIPFKPLSQRVLEEPFWLGLITVSLVLGFIALIWCLKRHFPENLEKLLNEDLDKNRGISWVSSGRSPSFRTGGGAGSSGVHEPIAGTTQQQAISPPTGRSFLGRFGIRKPSLLSLSSATSNVSGAVSPHSYENRTFSLDDLLRPSRSMIRTPSPHRRRNYSVQVRRDPAEKQQILQQLVSGGGSSSLDGEYKPPTPKPTLSEIIQMSERRLRLASASSMQSEAGSISGGGEASTSRQCGVNQRGEEETSFTTTNNNPNNLTPAAIKAEKKVTFARMLDKLAAASELASSSSCSDGDASCAEESKMVLVAPKPVSKKERKGRFRRSKSYNRPGIGGRNSETDQDYMDISSSDTTPDPIYTPRLPTRLCISPTGLAAGSGNSNANILSKPIQKIPKVGSADSLLALFRRISGTGSNSAPPSPQYSENEESSAGATPLSTPSSPRSSLLSIRPPALMITPEPNNTIELPVIDPFAQNQWRTPPSSSITLEVPMRDYCLSPIHEVPTPLGTPSHSPCHTPMMKRQSADENLPAIKIFRGSSEEDETYRSFLPRKDSPPARKRMMKIPVISISVDDEDEQVVDGSTDNTDPEVIGNERQDKDEMTRQWYRSNCLPGESEVIPDVLIHVPPDVSVESQPDLESFPLRDGEITPTSSSPRVKNKPPPLIFANEILSLYTDAKGPGRGEDDGNVQMIVPLVHISYATPVLEHLPKFPSICVSNEGEKVHDHDDHHDAFKTLSEMVSYPNIMFGRVGSLMGKSPLAPPTITINQSSEAESDSDTPTVGRHHMLHPNLCFLSPFAGGSDRVPSESNLSTSGYSSMASPCPSRCPSVSPLCPSEMEEYHSSCNSSCCLVHAQRRASLTPGTPKKFPLAPRRSSFNAPHHNTPGLGCDNRDKFCDGGVGAMIEERNRINSKGEEEHFEIETDSAVEVETDGDCGVTTSNELDCPLSPSKLSENQNSITNFLSEDMKCISTLLQIPKKGIPKSRSLDITETVLNHPIHDGYSPSDVNSIPDGRQLDKKGQLLRGLGPSLDSKLNNIDSNSGCGVSGTGVTIIFPFSTPSSISNTISGRKNTGSNLIEIPEEKEKRRRLSPVSSRSESPLSELSAAGGGFGFLGSPLTDSDGAYDCGGSSEVLTNNNETDTATGNSSSNRLGLFPLSRTNPSRRYGRGKKKEKKLIRNKQLSSDLSLIPAQLNSSETKDNVINSGATGDAAGTFSQDDSAVKPHDCVTGEPNILGSPVYRLDLPPNLARDLPSNSVALSPKTMSSKRRTRAHPAMDASSSSSESLASIRSRPRSRTSLGSAQNSYNTSRNNSPLPSVILDQDQNQAPNSPRLSLEESGSIKSSIDNEEIKPDTVPSSRLAPSAHLTLPGRKISRLRTISHQIRFLRRLELSLMRKKECLTNISRSAFEDRRENLLRKSNSSSEDSSRCDTSSSESSSSCTCSDCSDSCSECYKSDNDNEVLLLTASTSSNVGSGARKRRRKLNPNNVLESISTRDFDSNKVIKK